MRVIVVNLGTWPSFARLVRTEALDLYAERAGVEFWDASTAAALSRGRDFDLWGHWPKRLDGQPLRTARDVLDRIRHREDDGGGRLTVIMVFDRVDHALPPSPGDPASAAVASRAIVEQLREDLDPPEALRELSEVTFLAAIRTGGADEDARSAAFQAAGPGHGMQGPLFDVAVFLDRRSGAPRDDGADGRAMTALRVLIDVARDETASDLLLRPKATDIQIGRVFALAVRKPRVSPSAPIRRDLVALITRALAVENEPVPEAGGTASGKVVDDILERLDESAEARAVAEVATTDQNGAARQLRPAMEALWAVDTQPGDDAAWNAVATPGEADALFLASTRKVDDYCARRDQRLSVQREALDSQVRKVRDDFADRVEAACIDPSFGLARSFAGKLDTERNRLVKVLVGRSAAATAHRARRLALQLEAHRPADQVLAGPYAGFTRAFEHWLPAAVTYAGWVALAALVLLFTWPLLFAPNNRSWWPLAPVVGIAILAAIGGFRLRSYRSRLERLRREAKASYMAAETGELDRIREVSDQGLAQVVTARIAGGILPFVETLRRHARGYDRVRDAMQAILKTLQAGLEADATREPATGSIVGPGSARDVPERFRQMLWHGIPATMTRGVLAFDENRNPIEFASSQDLSVAVDVTVARVPPPRRGAA